MRFEPTTLDGAWVISPERNEDERGFFARTWCRREFQAHGLNADLVQCSVSCNYPVGVLRGMHYQAAPFGETKLVRCTRGAVFDVIIDLRPESLTFARWFGIDLTADNLRALYIPAGFAHGFQTLVPQTDVFYQMSDFYHPDASRGVRWDDPAFAIVWPHIPTRVISDRDRNYPDFTR